MLTIVTRFTLSTLAATRIIRSMKGETEVTEMAALHNKIALVTGASRGIGRATASALAAAGAHVLVHYGRSAQDAESLVVDIRSKEGRASAIQADLGTPDGATLVQQLLPVLGEGSNIIVISSLGAHAVVGKPGLDNPSVL